VTVKADVWQWKAGIMHLLFTKERFDVFMGHHMNKGREQKMIFSKGHESFNLEAYDICLGVLNNLEAWYNTRFSPRFFS